MSTYSFMDVVATLTSSSANIDLGYGAAIAEEGITFAMAGDKNTMTIGADGLGMHTLHADKSGMVIIRLLKTSPANAKLKQLYDVQASNSKMWGLNTITFNHKGSNDNGTASKCAFKKVPDLTYRKEGDIVEWIFEAIQLETTLGTYSDA